MRACVRVLLPAPSAESCRGSAFQGGGRGARGEHELHLPKHPFLTWMPSNRKGEIPNTPLFVVKGPTALVLYQTRNGWSLSQLAGHIRALANQ